MAYLGIVFGRDEPDYLVLMYDHFDDGDDFFKEFERRYNRGGIYYKLFHDVPALLLDYTGHTIKIDKTDNYVLEDHINGSIERYSHDIHHTIYIAKNGYWWTVGHDGMMIKTDNRIKL